LGTCPPDDATVVVVTAEVSVALEASAVVAAEDTATPFLPWLKGKQGSKLCNTPEKYKNNVCGIRTLFLPLPLAPLDTGSIAHNISKACMFSVNRDKKISPSLCDKHFFGMKIISI